MWDEQSRKQEKYNKVLKAFNDLCTQISSKSSSDEILYAFAYSLTTIGDERNVSKIVSEMQNTRQIDINNPVMFKAGIFDYFNNMLFDLTRTPTTGQYQRENSTVHTSSTPNTPSPTHPSTPSRNSIPLTPEVLPQDKPSSTPTTQKFEASKGVGQIASGVKNAFKGIFKSVFAFAALPVALVLDAVSLPVRKIHGAIVGKKPTTAPLAKSYIKSIRKDLNQAGHDFTKGNYELKGYFKMLPQEEQKKSAAKVTKIENAINEKLTFAGVDKEHHIKFDEHGTVTKQLDAAKNRTEFTTSPLKDILEKQIERLMTKRSEIQTHLSEIGERIAQGETMQTQKAAKDTEINIKFSRAPSVKADKIKLQKDVQQTRA